MFFNFILYTKIMGKKKTKLKCMFGANLPHPWKFYAIAGWNDYDILNVPYAELFSSLRLTVQEGRQFLHCKKEQGFLSHLCFPNVEKL